MQGSKNRATTATTARLHCPQRTQGFSWLNVVTNHPLLRQQDHAKSLGQWRQQPCLPATLTMGDFIIFMFQINPPSLHCQPHSQWGILSYLCFKPRFHCPQRTQSFSWLNMVINHPLLRQQDHAKSLGQWRQQQCLQTTLTKGDFIIFMFQISTDTDLSQIQYFHK